MGKLQEIEKGETNMKNEFQDFKYEPVYVKRPDGSIMTAFRIVDLPKKEIINRQKDEIK